MKNLFFAFALLIFASLSFNSCKHPQNDQSIEHNLVEEHPDEIETIDVEENINEVEPKGEVEPADEVEPKGEVEPKDEI